MDTIDALIMGILQGLAEFLPISSSGHLQICEDLLGLNLGGDDSLTFTVLLHVATVLSTIVVLWKEFLPLITSFFGFKRDANTSYVWKIIVSCIPIMIVGLLFKEHVEKLFEGSLLVVGIALCVTAVLLSFAYFFRRNDSPKATTGNAGSSTGLQIPNKSPQIVSKATTGNAGSSTGRDITFVDAFVIGLSQAIAVIPGLSRSGTTIATGLLLGNKREQVANFSFFMVIIPILGEAILDTLKSLQGGAEGAEAATNTPEIGITPLVVGFLASFIVGCIACKWMINIVKKGKLIWFAVYCLVAGAACIIF